MPLDIVECVERVTPTSVIIKSSVWWYFMNSSSEKFQYTLEVDIKRVKVRNEGTRKFDY